MNILIPFKKTKSGEIKRVKLGVSWTIFFFNFFGLVFFLRGVWSWAIISLVVMGVVSGVASQSISSSPIDLVTCLLLLFNGYMAIKGNELTAKFYLNHGYEPYEPASEQTRIALQNWNVHQTTEEGWKPDYALLKPQRFEKPIMLITFCGELALLYFISSFTNSILAGLTPTCNSAITIDYVKKIAEDKGVQIFDLQNITQVSVINSGVSCAARALTSNGSHTISYTAEKQSDGHLYWAVQNFD